METEVLQPVMLIVSKPLLCDCGAAAIYLVMEDVETPDGKRDLDYGAYCQSCFEKDEVE